MHSTIKRGNLICAALALLCLAAGVGCSPKSAHNRPLIVASLHNLSEPFFIAVRRELQSEAAKLDVEISVVDGSRIRPNKPLTSRPRSRAVQTASSSRRPT